MVKYHLKLQNSTLVNCQNLAFGQYLGKVYGKNCMWLASFNSPILVKLSQTLDSCFLSIHT